MNDSVPTSDAPELPPPRRGFFSRFLAGFIGFFVAAVPIAAAIGFALNPLLKRKPGAGGHDGAADSAGDDSYVRLTIGPDALPDNGTPQAVTITKDRVDAWNFYPDQRVGSIWLRRTESGGIQAFNTTCPHLGCFVEFRGEQRDFYCPCHLSNFDLNGARQNQIPPRDMDELETKIVDGKIWVKFQDFRGGTKDKVVV